MSVYAHSNGPDESGWQTLDDHSANVARLAEGFASAFLSGSHAALLGICHDLGKARKSFQSYLRRCNGIEDNEPDYGDHSHSGTGACWLAQQAGIIGKALAYCVAGHHAGLPDWSGGETPGGALSIRLKEDASVLSEPDVRTWMDNRANDWLRGQPKPPFPFSRDDSSLAFWIRMMYSCLVDADFLDTESFMAPERSSIRAFGQPLDVLASVFFSRLDETQRKAPNTDVNRIRAEIRAACERAADGAPGLFSLTVPTEGERPFRERRLRLGTPCGTG